jgi:MerR family mercuric resistance operon transcriptional regulator
VTTGCEVDTIRYYAGARLLPAPPRSAGGHRQHAEADRKRLLVIRRARQLEFSLEEIPDLLRLADRCEIDCVTVRSVAARHLEELERPLRSLEAWRRTLERLILACAREGGLSCPILDVLAGESDPRGAARRTVG